MSVITANPTTNATTERRARIVADAVVSAYIREISPGRAHNVSESTDAAPTPVGGEMLGPVIPAVTETVRRNVLRRRAAARCEMRFGLAPSRTR
jgi:hypothetical protein